MTHLVILGTIIFVNLIIGFVVYHNNPKSKNNKYFFLFILFMVLWVIANHLSNVDKDYSRVLFWNRITYLMPVIALGLLLYYSLVFTNKRNLKKSTKYILLLISLIVSGMVFTDLIILNVEISESVSIVIFGEFELLYVVYILSYFIASMIILFKKMFQNFGVIKKQLIYLNIGLLLFGTMTIITNLIIPFIYNDFIPSIYGPYFFVFFMISLSYSIFWERNYFW